MNTRQFFFSFLLCLIPFTLSGQRYISGRITDYENNESIHGVSVFFDNTTVGTTTDAEGQYRLKIPGEGSYRLTISHVGYQTVYKDIESGNTSAIFDVALHTIELEEVTVAVKVKFRPTDIHLFWKTILGKNPSRRTIQATNPEAVYYYYNPETRILKVSCREPLQIVNYETGYHIHYVLNRFTHDYNTGVTDWGYQCAFAELQPQNNRQKDNWEKNRKEVYDISVTKFIKSLYHNTLFNDGFVLADYSLSLINHVDLLSANQKTNSKTINLNSSVFLICYGMPVTAYDLESLQNLQKTSQQTSEQVFPPEHMPSSIPVIAQQQERNQTLRNRAGSLQQLQQIQQMGNDLSNHGKIMNVIEGDSIRIFPDGTFTNTLSMGRVNNSASLMGIGLRLPIDYAPDLPSHEAIAFDDRYVFDSVEHNFYKQLSIFPLEKIHLHTDRDYYVPGEKIWFKAYLADAATHQHITQSRYVYVELIDSRDSLVNRVMIRPENDMFFGYLPITKILPEGNYTLRAYTRYMENMGDDYFFKKNIRIGNLSTERVSGEKRGSRGIRENQINQTNHTNHSQDYDVSFFPEGGNLVDGSLCKVAFKAINRSGYSEIISGNIIDETGLEITTLQTFHAGMGVFSFIPGQGKRYFLKCRNENGLEKQFELPHADPRAIALTVAQHNKRIGVELRKSAESTDIPCYLLGHCRGMVFYFSSWNPENEYVAFSEAELPAGVIQFILFDQQMNPLSERLIFNKNYDEAKVEFQTDKDLYEKREKVIVTLTPSPWGRAGVGLLGLSIAVTDDMDIPVDSSTTILSSLLLSSELKGYIENPAWYLQDNPQSATALDLLMMTHGWRRYNIPEVAKGNTEYPPIPYQTSQEISGSVKRPGRSGAVAKSNVLVQVTDGDFGIISSDEEGRFVFSGFEYPDSTTFFLRALGNRVNDRFELVLDRESFPKPVYAPQSPRLTPPLTTGEGGLKEETKSELDPDAFIVKAEKRSKFDEDMWMIHLSEVEITAPRIEKKEEPRLEYWANASSDVTIRREDFERVPYYYAVDHLRTVPSVQVYIEVLTGETTIYINRGISSFEGQFPALIIIDGVPSVSLEALRSEEVESIDVFKGVSTTAFGVRGANGVISITTRRGGENSSSEKEKINQTVYTPLGYQKPVEFYSPKYETLEAKRSVIPDYRTTIFWKPDVVISDDGEASFEFYTSDFKTTYSVVIEGLTNDGRIIRQVEKIRVE